MKHNVLFAVLTALILALGFNGADIIGHFISTDSAEMTVIPRDRSNSNAVYLNEDKKAFDPMSLVTKTAETVNSRENTEVRDIATAMITAMSTDNEKTCISDYAQPLRNSLKFSRNDYIYVEKWSYLNPLGEKRMLDCIIWTEDLSIAYIRFYSPDTVKLSGSEMNSGLDRLDNFSSSFYPTLSDIFWNFDNIRADVHSGRFELGNINEIDPELAQWYADLLDLIDLMDRKEDSNTLIDSIVRKYETFSSFVHDNFQNSDEQLTNYWLPQLAFKDIITTKGSSALAGTKIVNIFCNMNGVWLKPTYSAENGIIYQTIQAGKNELTIIYNVRNDMIEGFYFPATQYVDENGWDVRQNVYY